MKKLTQLAVDAQKGFVVKETGEPVLDFHPLEFKSVRYNFRSNVEKLTLITQNSSRGSNVYLIGPEIISGLDRNVTVLYGKATLD